MKRNIPLKIAAAIFLAGCACLILGLVAKSDFERDEALPLLDLSAISDKSFGTAYKVALSEDYLLAEKGAEKSLYYTLTDDGDDSRGIGIYVPHSMRFLFEAGQGAASGEAEFKAVLRKATPELIEKLRGFISDYIVSIYEIMDMEIPDGEFERAYEKIRPYYLDVAGTEGYTLPITVGAALVFAAAVTVLVILCRRKLPRRARLIVFAAVPAVLVIAAVLALKDSIATMLSVRELSDGFYSMSYSGDYKTDEFLGAGITTSSELVCWIADNVYYGLFDKSQINIDDFGCSAFSAASSDGDSLMGRNFDYDETDALIVYTNPSDGYASLGMVDLKFFGIGAEEDIPTDSFAAKACMLAAPYVCMDGMNEAGVGVGILRLGIDETHQDKGKPALLIYGAIRGILDKCGSVDEAVNFLASYDIHTALGCSYHLFVADKSGKSAVVEWLDNEMTVVDTNGCTNSVLTAGAHYLEGDPDERYSVIKSRLGITDNTLSAEEAMSLLSEVSEKGTEWSCVYNLADFTVNVCLDRDYENIYSFGRNCNPPSDISS